MRTIPAVIVTLMLGLPCVADCQSFDLYAAAGPTLTDPGNSVAAGAIFSPISRLSILASAERTHLAAQTDRDGDVTSYTRGGTLYLGSAEARYTPLSRERVGPYVLAGLATGISTPNVTDVFPNPVTNFVFAFFAGGGLQVPLGKRVALLGDVRVMLGAEGREGVVGVAPARVGLAWRF